MKVPSDIMQVHRLECPNALVSCTLKCGLDIRREELVSHLTNDCPKREVVCQHCKKGFATDSMAVSHSTLSFPLFVSAGVCSKVALISTTVTVYSSYLSYNRSNNSILCYTVYSS